MALTFNKRNGKIIGITGLGAELKWAFRNLVGRKMNDRTKEDGEYLMNSFTEKQITDAAASYDRDVYINSAEY